MRKIGIILASIFCLVIIFNMVICYWLYPLKYQAEIIAAANKYQIAAPLIAAVINTESSFVKNKVSPKNAVGLMQILPSTAYYLTKQDDNLFDPQTNIDIGTQYLAYLFDRFSDTTTVLFAYNAGEGNVRRWLAEYNTETLTTCPYSESNNYVRKVLHSLKYYQWRL